MIDKLQVQHKIDQIEQLQKELFEMLLSQPDVNDEIDMLEDEVRELQEENENLQDQIIELQEEIDELKEKSKS